MLIPRNQRAGFCRNDIGDINVTLSGHEECVEGFVKDLLSRFTGDEERRVVSVPIDNIEAAAGGSVRCMLAEIHLPTAGNERNE